MKKFGRCLVGTAVSIGALVVVPGAGMDAVGAAPALTCQGEPATIVGGPRKEYVKGTSGDDVIVSNGSEEVDAGAGDDLVCMTEFGSGGEGSWLGVGGGPGDDSISAALSDQDLLFVVLGTGEDTFAGGPESDYVVGGEPEEEEHVSHDSETDVIDTGSGYYDTVLVGDGGPLTDQVRVRGRAAQIEAHASTLADGGSLRGSSGATLTVVDSSTAASGAWSLDLDAGTAGLAGVPTFSWTGFGRIVWAVPGTVDVAGSAGDDRLVGPVVSGDLGAGDDNVYVWSSATDHGSRTADLLGGAGTDQVRFFSGEVDDIDPGPGGGVVPFTPGDVTVDVRAQRTTFGSGEEVGLADFEWYGAQSNGVVELLGGPGPDTLYGSACDLRFRGHGGDDVMREVPNVGSAGFTGADCDDYRGRTRVVGGTGDDYASITSRSTLLGGEGDDRLDGGHWRDRIVGGPGDDRLFGDHGDDVLTGDDGVDLARGGRGTDSCRAEYGADCEHPRAGAQLDPYPPGSRPSTVLLRDPVGDVERDGVVAPDEEAADVVSVRTSYRRREITFRVRLRSLVSEDHQLVGIDLRYAGDHQYHYFWANVVVPPTGRPRLTVDTEDPHRCRHGLTLDRAAATVEVRLTPSCFGRAGWIRAAVFASTTHDPDSRTYLNRDGAPHQFGNQARYGPFTYSPDQAV